MKKIATIAASIATLALAVVPAMAVGNNCSNATTGPFSTNNCTINNSSNVTVNNVNDAVIVNNVTSRSNTGGNRADYNTLGGSVTTGNATNNTTVQTVANVNTTNITGGPSMGSNTGTNNVTGPYSANDIYLQNALRTGVNNSNTAFVLNNVDTTANTGENSASYNTGPGSIRTGNSLLNTGVASHVNDNLTEINAGAGGSGGNTAWNATTGPFSANAVVINNDANVFVDNLNDMVVRNNVDADSNTGRNAANYNTLGGDITSGGAGAGVVVDSEGNITTTGIAVTLGGAANGGGTAVSGPESSNAVYVNNAQDITVNNWNNKCRSHNASTIGYLLDTLVSDADIREVNCRPWDLGVTNNVDVVSDTGSNSASYGTGPATVLDGASSLISSTLTHINDVLTRITN